MEHSFEQNAEVTRTHHPACAEDPSATLGPNQGADGRRSPGSPAHFPNDTVCTDCNAVVVDGLWRMDAGQKHFVLCTGAAVEVICPACRQIRERSPQGLLTLQGGFWPNHQVEILHLLHNEAREALADAPMERIVAIRTEKDQLMVETTNKELAQRLGRALYRAYQGELDYHWSDTDLARVDWARGC